MKRLISSILLYLASRRLKKRKGKLIVVAGSVGKTTTTQAIAQVLGSRKNVIATRGNLNTEFGLPFVVLELENPRMTKSPLYWLGVISKAFSQSLKPLEYEMIILEIGTDRPGDIARFKKILKADIAVVTAVSAEHMESFKSLEAVYKEELSVADFSDKLLINSSSVPQEMQKEDSGKKYLSYGMSQSDDFSFEIIDKKQSCYEIKMNLLGDIEIANVCLIGNHMLLAALASASVAKLVGIEGTFIGRALSQLQPQPGRMQLLHGIEENSYIIDDSYNSSPLAAEAALDALYELPATSRIAILGSMNELGSYSVRAHKALGAYCRPDKLDLVVTVGEDANNYLAPASKSAGCLTKSYKTSPEAVTFVLSTLKPGSVVLVKGSQNGVFSEEAIKMLLRNPKDEAKLVRQSEEWMKIKRDQGLVV